MKNKTPALLTLAAILTAGVILAAGAIDRGPQRARVTIQNGTGEITLIAPGGTARAVVEAVFFAGAGAATTQTVSLVSGSVTNTAFTKVIAATDRLATASNLPTLFAGDKLLITSTDTSNTNKLPAYVFWKLID